MSCVLPQSCAYDNADIAHFMDFTAFFCLTLLSRCLRPVQTRLLLPESSHTKKNSAPRGIFRLVENSRSYTQKCFAHAIKVKAPGDEAGKTALRH